MQPSEPFLSNPDMENAALRDQLAVLQAHARRLEARYQTLMGETAQIHWLVSSDGLLREAQAWCAFTGQSRADVEANGPLQAVHPEDRAGIEQAWRRALATGQGFGVEHRIRRHDGVYRTFISRGRPVPEADGFVSEWIGWSRDIEEESRNANALKEQAARIEAEVAQRTEALRKSESMLAESQRLARTGSWELDVPTLQLNWSEQQFRLFGFEPTMPSISRALVIPRIDPRDRERHEAVVKGAIEHGTPFAMEYRVVLPGGEVLHIHSIGRPVFDAEGRVVKLIGTSQDVTERSRLEEQLRAQFEQLKKLDQLKNNFVNSVTHELRTPLTSIVGYAEFLEDEIGGPILPRQRDFVHQIQHAAKRLEYLLNDLLDFARMEAGTFSLRVAPAELGDRVREVIESLRPQADDLDLSLEACLPASPLQLEMDAQRIGQVLTNLISNAIKFSPKGGKIGITALQRGAKVRCEVRDSGPGITLEDMPRLFQRFSQLEAGVRMGKGTGLGLSISRALVEAHGGSIGVESTPGAGCTFWFELPITPSDGPTGQAIAGAESR